MVSWRSCCEAWAVKYGGSKQCCRRRKRHPLFASLQQPFATQQIDRLPSRFNAARGRHYHQLRTALHGSSLRQGSRGSPGELSQSGQRRSGPTDLAIRNVLGRLPGWRIQPILSLTTSSAVGIIIVRDRRRVARMRRHTRSQADVLLRVHGRRPPARPPDRARVGARTRGSEVSGH